MAMIKGMALTTTTSFVEEEFGKPAKEEWLESLDNETQHAYRFALATSWYSMDLYWKGGMAACQRFAPGRIAETMRKWGAHTARSQLTGIYRLLLKLGSPNKMLSSAPRMWGTFNSEGTISVPVNEKGSAVLRLEGLSLHDPLFGESLAGWMEEAIRLSGAKRVAATVTQTPRTDKDFFEFSIDWS
jgi:uncharacterized protein (TIGR02265 family)